MYSSAGRYASSASTRSPSPPANTTPNTQCARTAPPTPRTPPTPPGGRPGASGWSRRACGGAAVRSVVATAKGLPLRLRRGFRIALCSLGGGCHAADDRVKPEYRGDRDKSQLRQLVTPVEGGEQ